MKRVSKAILVITAIVAILAIVGQIEAHCNKPNKYHESYQK